MKEKERSKRCQVFIFQETIILCEEPQPSADSPAGYPPDLDFLASFKMNKVIKFIKKLPQIPRSQIGQCQRNAGGKRRIRI